MNEIMLKGKSLETYLIDLDFTSAAVGSKELINHGDSDNYHFTRLAMAGGGVDGVVDHPVFGKCYYFDNKGYFISNATPVLYNKDFLVEIESYHANASTSCIYATGGYPLELKSGYIFAYMNASKDIAIMNYNQTTTTFSQTQAGFPETTNVMSRLAFRYNATAKTFSITNQLTNAVVEKSINLQAESYLMIGARHKAGNITQGDTLSGQFYLKSLRVRTL